ncbi:MAG: WG repeat-containing protein [Caldisericia bacterium]
MKERRPWRRTVVAIVLVAVVLATSLAMYHVIRTRTGKEVEVTTLIPYRKGDKWGFCNSNKKVIIPTVYDGARPFSDGIAMVQTNGKFGCINKDGSMVIPAIYSHIDAFSEDLALVGLDGEYRYLDKTGKTIIGLPSTCDSAGDFHDGRAWVMMRIEKKGYKYGFIDKEGNFAVEPVYDRAFDFYSGSAVVAVGQKYGVINTSGKRIVPVEYDQEAWLTSEGPIPVAVGDKFGFVDLDGTMTIQPVYDYAWGFRDGLAQVSADDKKFFIDTKGDKVIDIDTSYEEISGFSEGLAAVKVCGKWGYIDSKGTMAIQPSYDAAGSFHEGLAIVLVNGKEGCIKTDGSMAVPATYDANDYFLSDFHDGLALVQLIGKGSMVDGGDRPTIVGYIDTKGTQYWEN